MTAIIEPGGADIGQDLPDDVVAYLAAVRSLLADLDPGEVEDLCDDIEQHLLEVRGETDQPFAEVVGSPESFVAELRQSAGLPGSADPVPKSPLTAFTTLFDRARRTLIEHPLTTHVMAFLPELRPATWVARGYLIAALLAMTTASWNPFTFLLIPRIFDNAVVGLILTAGLIAASVRLGRARRTGPSFRPTSSPTIPTAHRSTTCCCSTNEVDRSICPSGATASSWASSSGHRCAPTPPIGPSPTCTPGAWS